jgi:uncharacterized protein YaaN involved in tellurite resistance
MMTEEQPGDQVENPAVDLAGSQELVPVEAKEPVPPKGVGKEELGGLKSRALALVSELGEASGSRELELTDSITSLGIQTQRTAGGELDLLRARVGDMLGQEGAAGDIANDLVDLRLALNQINPHELRQAAGMRKVLRFIPFVSKFPPALKVLEKVAIRYEPVSKQVSLIETKLREGRGMLARDNIELRKLYEQVESQQLPIQKNAYLGELVMNQLTELLDDTEDTLKVERVRNALHDVAMRVQDLRTMEEVHIQFFVSIEMTRQNNNRLGQSVERTLALGSNVVMVGLAIQSALTRQKRVMEATQRTREFLGNLIVANAASIKQHTQEIGDVYNNPVIAIDMITQAHNDLIEAMNTADRLKQEGIDKARENIAKLSQLSTELQERSQGLREQRATEPSSIEA